MTDGRWPPLPSPLLLLLLLLTLYDIAIRSPKQVQLLFSNMSLPAARLKLLGVGSSASLQDSVDDATDSQEPALVLKDDLARMDSIYSTGKGIKQLTAAPDVSQVVVMTAAAPLWSST
jgi:hypothetical protein